MNKLSQPEAKDLKALASLDLIKTAGLKKRLVREASKRGGEFSEEEAYVRGYMPCSRCNPPKYE